MTSSYNNNENESDDINKSNDLPGMQAGHGRDGGEPLLPHPHLRFTSNNDENDRGDIDKNNNLRDDMKRNNISDDIDNNNDNGDEINNNSD